MRGFQTFYRVLRPLLIRLEPELSHRLTLFALRQFDLLPASALSDSPIRLAGINFKNRLGLAAGFDKDGSAFVGLSRLGFGFIELGAVTPQPQLGNAKPRLFRLKEDQAVINRMGFNNLGVDQIVYRLIEGAGRVSIPIGVNIGRNATTTNDAAYADYRNCLTKLFTLADFITVNISSPNTVGLRRLQDRQEARSLLTSLIADRNKQRDIHEKELPLFVKISPDLEQDVLLTLVDAITDAGCDGLIATNTTVQRPKLSHPAGEERGGLSGKPLFELSLATVNTVRAHVGPAFPIIGVGGIHDVSTAQGMLNAGANLLQLYTGLVYHGPGLVDSLLDGIKET